MGVCGQYIDAISDVQRDRIIEAREIIVEEYEDANGSGCLVGTAEGAEDQAVADALGYFRVEFAFDRLSHRFGKDRIVRLCKARAAKNNAPKNDGSLGGAQPQGRRPVTSWVKAAKEVVKP